MHLFTAPVLPAVLLAALCQSPTGGIPAQGVTGIRVRVEALKRSSFEGSGGAGPVLIGSQPALELEWVVRNTSGKPVEMRPPSAALRLRVSGPGSAIPVRTEWAAEMKLQTEDVVFTTLPLGPAVLPDSSTLRVRGSSTTVDGSAFAPGDYVLELNVRGFQQVSADGARTVPFIDPGHPVHIRIVAVDSPERQRQFHLTEGAFYKNVDGNRALDHFLALTLLPGAPWTDSLPLAWMYGDVGRHRDACVVFRRILPETIRALDAMHRYDRGANLRRAAMSCAVDGDIATATDLLRTEGRIPPWRISAEIEKLRKAAPKPR